MGQPITQCGLHAGTRVGKQKLYEMAAGTAWQKAYNKLLK
jgi:hypothetical protein